MKQYKRMFDKREKFLLWEKASIMNQYKNIIIQLIDNNILEEEKKFFLEVYRRYETSCYDLYSNIISLCGEKIVKDDNYILEFNWDINFNENTMFITVNELNKRKFDINEFSINSLNLLESFKEKLKSLLA